MDFYTATLSKSTQPKEEKKSLTVREVWQSKRKPEPKKERKPLTPDYELPEIYRGEKPLIDNRVMSALETIPSYLQALGRGVGGLAVDAARNPAPYVAGAVGSALLPEAAAFRMAGMGMEALIPVARGLMSYAGYQGTRNDQAAQAGIPREQIQQEALAALPGFLAPNNPGGNAVASILQSLMLRGELPPGEELVQSVGVPKVLGVGGSLVQQIMEGNRRGAINLMPWKEQTINRKRLSPQQRRDMQMANQAMFDLAEDLKYGDITQEQFDREYPMQNAIFSELQQLDLTPTVRGPEEFRPGTPFADRTPARQMQMASTEALPGAGLISNDPGWRSLFLLNRAKRNIASTDRYHSASFGGEGIGAEPTRTPTSYDPFAARPNFDELPVMRRLSLREQAQTQSRELLRRYQAAVAAGRMEEATELQREYGRSITNLETLRDIPTDIQVRAENTKSLEALGLDERAPGRAKVIGVGEEPIIEPKPTREQFWEMFKAEQPDMYQQALEAFAGNEEQAKTVLIPQLLKQLGIDL